MSKVCAVIPVFGRDDVLATVPRLLAWHPGLRIVVVDNGNAPERAAKIAALSGMTPRSEGASGTVESGRVEVVRLEENRGGSGGYIAGMRRVLERHRDCELVWLLDDDAEPNEGTLPGLVKAYEKLIFEPRKVTGGGLYEAEYCRSDIRRREDAGEVPRFDTGADARNGKSECVTICV